MASSYPDVMPSIWSQEELNDADGLAPERELAFGTNLAAEGRGKPQNRTWLALATAPSSAICVSSSTRQNWESVNDVDPIPGVTHRFHHLYLA